MGRPASRHLRAEDLPPLKAGDIVLVRHKRGFARWFLRKVMGSYWDHSAMVLYPKDLPAHLAHTVIIEAIRDRSFVRWQPRGTGLHLLHKYLHHPEKYDVGIKRVTGLDDAGRRRVITYMLMNVDAPYWPWESPAVILAAIFPSLRPAYLASQRFSCSGLIQKAFYDAVGWDRKRDVTFREGLWSPIELQELVSPGDIASSPNAEWIYNKR